MGKWRHFILKFIVLYTGQHTGYKTWQLNVCRTLEYFKLLGTKGTMQRSSAGRTVTGEILRNKTYLRLTVKPRHAGIFEFWNLHISFEHRQWDFRVPVEIPLVYWRHKFVNFSLHIHSIKYFKNSNYFWSILNLFFFQLMRLFRKDFQRNVQHSIQMLHITKRSSNVHFILGYTVRSHVAWMDP